MGGEADDEMEERHEAEVMADMKDDRIRGVRGEAKPFRRMAIFRGKVSMEPIARRLEVKKERKKCFGRGELLKFRDGTLILD